MLAALIGCFALSQAYRTTAGILSVPLISQFGLDDRQMAVVAGVFHLAFGSMQLLMGIGIDVFGIRRTIVIAFPLTIAGAALAALAPSPAVLIASQALIGIGCAPAFLVCTVFIARHFPAEKFAAMSGLALGMGGLGLIFTGTPLAWLAEHFGWRACFWVLSGLSLLGWVMIYLRVFEPAALAVGTATGTSSPARATTARPSLLASLKGYGALLRMPHTAGILALVFVGYASFISLRGLWLAPLLVDRFGQSLIFSGNVALALSLISLFAPSLFGRMDPGDARRRYWLMAFPWSLVLLFVLLACASSLTLAIGCIIGVAICMGYTVWQYADVRSAYPSDMTGRAMALFTMSMFLGVAFMQWLSGQAASWAEQHGHEKYAAVFGCIAAMIAAGTLAYTLLPKPARKP
ncbi:MFS transporter [Corticibacter populi]|uniref:MFS transporter n=2 Tax=Corticibacter populi TaxID=1550736 RepID=A0A3M6QXB1_9BURK|nr:MFS transporter [Corticibacter populi]